MSQSSNLVKLYLTGLYKCVARKNRRTDDAVISVKTAEEAVTCTVPTLENGVTTPNKGQLEVGDSVQFKCKKGFRITGEHILVIVITDNINKVIVIC